MDKMCRAPINELRKPYVCTVCGRIYHNIFCGTFTESSSLCSGCSAEKSKKKEKVVDKVEFVKPVTKPMEKPEPDSKEVLELVQKEDFGQSWFYKTNDDIKRYAHFFWVEPKKHPRLFMAEPSSVKLDDLELKVCLF